MKRNERNSRFGVGGICMCLLLLCPAIVWQEAGAMFSPRQKERRFEFKGVVKSVDRPHRSATIRH